MEISVQFSVSMEMYDKKFPVPRKFFISDLKYFVSNLISGQKFFWNV